MHTIVKQALNHVGFPNVKVADDGPTAMPMLKNGSFDFWVFDWNMAQRQDIDLLKAVRTDSSLQALQVLMKAAEAKKEQITEAAKSGINDYCIKPFNREKLNSKIDDVFNKLQSADALLQLECHQIR